MQNQKRTDISESKSVSDAWHKTAKGRLRFELAGLAFACRHGFSPQDYAQHLWTKGSVGWMGKTNPTAAEYLLKEAEAFARFYPEVSFEVVESGDTRAELVFTHGCLGGWGRDQWAVARTLGLDKKEICAYCQEAFRVWAQPFGLHVEIGPDDTEHCHLRVEKL